MLLRRDQDVQRAVSPGFHGCTVGGVGDDQRLMIPAASRRPVKLLLVSPLEGRGRVRGPLLILVFLDRKAHHQVLQVLHCAPGGLAA